jgi:3D (Asp-Asp-Asp) domain-containing protein
MRRTVLTVLLLACALSGCAHNYRRDIPRGVQPVRVAMEVTGYSDDKKSTNWKRNWRLQPVIASGPSKGKPKKVGITASGKKAKQGTIAADTSLYPFGTIMHVPGYGYGQVQDRGSAIKGQKIDLFFEKKKDALKWGRRRNVPVTVWVAR